MEKGRDCMLELVNEVPVVGKSNVYIRQKETTPSLPLIMSTETVLPHWHTGALIHARDGTVYETNFQFFCTVSDESESRKEDIGRADQRQGDSWSTWLHCIPIPGTWRIPTLALHVG